MFYLDTHKLVDILNTKHQNENLTLAQPPNFLATLCDASNH